MSHPFDQSSPFRAQFIQSTGTTDDTFIARITSGAGYRPHVAINGIALEPRQFTILESDDSQVTVKLALIPEAGDTITIWTESAGERVTDFLPGQPIADSAVDAEFGQLIRTLRAQNASVRSALRFADTDFADPGGPLPGIQERACHVLAFDANGAMTAAPYTTPDPAHPTGSLLLDESFAETLPETRPDGTGLADGDLVRDGHNGALYIRRSSAWLPAYAAVTDYVPRNGSTPLTGALDLGAHHLSGVARVQGRRVSEDGATLAACDRLARRSLTHLADLSVRNAWNLSQIAVSDPGAVANLYLDDFDTVTGVSRAEHSGLAIWNDQDCGTVTVHESGRYARQSGGSNNFQFVAARVPRASGRFYVEIAHSKTEPVASAYTWHGIRQAGTAAVAGNPPPTGYILCSNDGDIFDGYRDVPRPDSFAETWPQNHVPEGTVGTVAVDIDRGEVWLGFVRPDLTTWWHGDGDPAEGRNPTAGFSPGAEVVLAGGLWGAEDFALRLNAGQENFRGAVPAGFRAGWHNGDADILASENVRFDEFEGSCRPERTCLTQLDTSVDWTQSPHWYGYRNPSVRHRAYQGLMSWLLETGGSGSPTMLHYDWGRDQNLDLVNATRIDVTVSVASSHMTSSGAGYGTNLQTGWVDDHDAPTRHMRLGAYLLGGKIQSLTHPGGSVVDPCPAISLSNDTWYKLSWQLTKPPGFTAAEQSLTFLIDDAVVWSGTFAANDGLAVENGVWAGSNDGLQFFHQHDGYPYWISAISDWRVRTNFNAPQPMTLYSRRIHCDSAPEILRVLTDVGTMAGLTENTDFAVSISRNDGADWQEVPLVRAAQVSADRWILRGDADIAGAPSGKRIRIRFRTFNQSDPVLHRWLLAADTSLYL